MNRILIIPIGLICAMSLWAQSYSESYNVVSDAYNNKIEDVKVIRNINGGTVIIPIFDQTCPEELKTPFMYACKIVEEYMPSSLPLKIKNFSFVLIQNGPAPLSASDHFASHLLSKCMSVLSCFLFLLASL